jgi:AmmeMemoRadiSam system protein B/AmmeMemoRadiSam system protein A
MIQECPLLLVLLVSLGVTGCTESGGSAASTDAGPANQVRRAAVAGLFYPRHADLLSEQLEGLLADVDACIPLKNLRGLVAPHAGYDYSGKTAACAYKQLMGRDINTVVVLAPSHYARFQGASVPAVTSYETPLGKIPVSPQVRKLAETDPFCSNPRCEVQRPGWWRQAPKEVPPFGEDTAHTWEHALEVQLPFLQKVLDQFKLVPAVFGEVDPEKAARALDSFLDSKTIVVASSDLSHYYPYDTATQLDASCVRAICDLDVKWMQNEEACGKGPVLTLMHLARRRGWQTKLLDYRNSGDTSGDRRGVVGYTAIAFYEGDAEASVVSAELTAGDKSYLLDLARSSLTQAVRDSSAPELVESEVPERLRRRGACFVTLTKEGELRGCIGHIFACAPIYTSAIENAAKAATEDPRFPAVSPDELDQIHIEISVLTKPCLLEYSTPQDLLEKLRPGVDGVVFGLGGHRATYLPQVWEQIPEKEQFLAKLAQKARLEPTAWKDPNAAFLTYQVDAFHEEPRQ